MGAVIDQTKRTGASSTRPDSVPASVFISYSRKDVAFVRRLDAALTERGRDTWVDWDDIAPSAQWMREIYAGIDAAAAVIFVISPDAAASAVCALELEHAIAHSKRLIPIQCREVDASALPDPVRSLNWIRVLDGEAIETKIDEIIGALDTNLPWARAHARLLVRSLEWQGNPADSSRLLRGAELKETEQWLATIGSGELPLPTPLQRQFVLASRQAQSTWERFTLAGAGAALLITAALAVYALVQSQIATEQRNVALSRLLAAHAQKNATDATGRRDLALLQSVAANQIASTVEAKESLSTALSVMNRANRFLPAADTLVALAVSPDGKSFATGHFHGALTLWDARTLAKKKTIEKADVRALQFSPDSRTLATAGLGIISLRDGETGEVRERLDAHRDGARRLLWLPDGKTLVAASINSGSLLVMDVADPSKRLSLKVHHRGIRDVALSPDGSTIAVVPDAERRIMLWDTGSWTERRALTGSEMPVRSIAFNHDGSLLASGGEEALLRIWNPHSGELVRSLDRHDGQSARLAFSSDGRWLVSGSDNRLVYLWDLQAGSPRERLIGHTNSLMDLAFFPDAKTLISAAFEETLIAWSIEGPAHHVLLPGHVKDVTALAVSPDGSVLASGGVDRSIRLWDLSTGQQRSVLTEHRGPVRALAYRPDGAVLASGSDDDRRIILWDARQERMLQDLDGQGNVKSLDWSTDGSLLASSAEGRDAIDLWDPAGRRLFELKGHQGSINSLAFSAQGKTLVSGGGDEAIRVWDLAVKQEVAVYGSTGGAVAQATLSPNGSELFCLVNWSGCILLWTLNSPNDPVALSVEQRGGDRRVSFSPDGTRLAYVSGEIRNRIELLNLNNRTVDATIDTDSTILTMAFARDGKRLVTGHFNGTISLWNVNTVQWPNRACAIANRNLTRIEWRSLIGDALPYRAVCPDLPLPDE